MNCSAKTVTAIDTKLEDYVQTLVRVNLVGIRRECVLQRLRNDARRQVPSEFLNVYKSGSSSSIHPKFLKSTSNDMPRKICEREENHKEGKSFRSFSGKFRKISGKNVHKIS